MPDDTGLVHRAAAADQAAWREIYARHAPAVRRVAAGFASLGTGDVEDVVQETFVRAFGRLEQLQDPARLRGWLLSIARSRALNRLRSQQTQGRMARAYAADPAVGLKAVGLGSDSRARSRRVQIVRDLIDSLPPGPEAETVRLFYVEGELSARQIAERLGVGKSAITMRLERFRARVKAQLVARLLEAGEEPT